MPFRKMPTSFPCWARDTSLLKHDVHKSIRRRVQALNKMGHKEGRWYDSDLTTRERARIILDGMAPKGDGCWNVNDLDEFMSRMNKILWPNVMYDQRARILFAEANAGTMHPPGEMVDCYFCRESAYRGCATRLLASVLDDNEARYAANQVFLQKKRKVSGFTVQLPPPGSIANTTELPTWVRRPEVLDVCLQKRVVNIIRGLRSSGDTTTWHLNIMTDERVDIILAQMQRRFTKRIMTAVETRHPMEALLYLFEPKYVLNLRSKLQQELQSRRDEHPSKWNQANGIWAVVKYVLTKVLKDCEEFEELEGKWPPTRTTNRLLSWIKDRFRRKEPWYRLSSSAHRRNSCCLVRLQAGATELTAMADVE
ncbi:hypothetical protein F5Y10DRAFT_284316 [Nemania abortiva]|nr:hypothetical protein F5Y10DRAFT_284316 [Nemania abortiva]